MKAALEKLIDYGFENYILSAYSQSALFEACEHYNITKYFKKIKGLDNHYAAGKTEEAKELLLEIGKNPSDIILFGDTVHDYEVSKSVGIDSVLIKNGHQNEFILSSCNAPIVSNISSALIYLFN